MSACLSQPSCRAGFTALAAIALVWLQAAVAAASEEDTVRLEPTVDAIADPASGASEGVPDAAAELALEAEAAARDEARATPQAVPRTRFVLRELRVGPSRYLQRAQIDAVIARLTGQTIDLRDLGTVTRPFDDVLRAQDIALAGAVIRSVDPARGIVELGFYEPLIGRVVVSDGRLAPGSVYARRLGFEPGQPADTRMIEARQTRLEVLTGVTTQVAVQPGSRPDELDLVVTPAEPPALRFAVTLDDHGSAAFGREQLTLTASHASLTGNLDALSASVTASRGQRSAAFGYAFPVTADGLALFFAGSYEVNRTQVGPVQEGRTTSVEIGLSQPAIVRRDRQLTFRASLQRFDEERRTFGVLTTDQSGTALTLGAAFGLQMASGGLSYDQSIRFVEWRNGAFGDEETLLLAGEGAWAHRLSDSWQLFGRLGWQAALGDNSPARFRTTLSSPTRVRGYPSGNSSGDSSVFASLQLQQDQPLRLGGSDSAAVSVQPFVFVDAGRAFDRVGGTTTAQDTLASAGIGGVFGLGERTIVEVSAARPLRDANGFDASGAWRADFRLGVRF